MVRFSTLPLVRNPRVLIRVTALSMVFALAAESLGLTRMAKVRATTAVGTITTQSLRSGTAGAVETTKEIDQWEFLDGSP
jgi:hypothetical protein